MSELDSKQADIHTAGGDRQPHRGGDAVAAMNDTRLLVAVGQGRQAAFAEAYRRHAGPVYGLAARLCGPDVAADVTQEVFMALWSAPERFEPQRGTLRSFLLTQTHSRAVDRLRADTARRAREANTARPDLWRHAPGVEYEALARLAGTEACNLLSDLPAPTAQAIILAYFAGYTYRQVADRLGQPEGTVKSHIRAGLTQLRSKLDDHKPSATS